MIEKIETKPVHFIQNKTVIKKERSKPFASDPCLVIDFLNKNGDLKFKKTNENHFEPAQVLLGLYINLN